MVGGSRKWTAFETRLCHQSGETCDDRPGSRLGIALLPPARSPVTYARRSDPNTRPLAKLNTPPIQASTRPRRFIDRRFRHGCGRPIASRFHLQTADLEHIPTIQAAGFILTSAKQLSLREYASFMKLSSRRSRDHHRGDFAVPLNKAQRHRLERLRYQFYDPCG